MAGSGHRFKVAGYKKHKPLIDVNGKPMIQRVIENLRPKTREYRFVFICLKNMVTLELMEIFQNEPNSYVIQLPYITEGAACTALTSLGIMDADEPLILAACDQLIDIPIDDFIDYAWGYDGCIATFKNEHLNHSFCVIKNDRVKKVVEKPPKKISDDANIGIYWFKHSSFFHFYTEEMIDRNERINGEFYIAPVYNEMIGDEFIVTNYNIDKESVHLIGTPKELDDYTKTVRNSS